MRVRMLMTMLPMVGLVAACGGRDSARMDEAMRRDLALAAAAQPAMTPQYMSPAELGYAPQPYPQPMMAYQQPVYAAPRPAPRPAAQPTRVVYRDAPAPAPAPQPTGRRIVKRNTARDAAIGAVVGGAAGAAIKKNTKGAVVGAAAGGVIGAIIGHTVDVKRQ
jgi:hypothetical protein